MQYKIPQEIAREDKLVGPLSLRQLIIVGIGGGICYMIYISLVKVTDAVVYVPPIAVIGLITVAVAFFKKDNITFTRMILLFLEMIINPLKRVWVKSAGGVSPFDIMDMYSQEEIQKAKQAAIVVEKRVDNIDQLVKVLDYDLNTTISEENEKKLSFLQKEKEGQSSFLESIAHKAAESVAQEMKDKQPKISL